MWDKEAVEFRCGGVWYKTLVTQLGIDLCIYTSDETDTPIWYESMPTFANEDADESSESGITRIQAWEQLSLGGERYHPKSTALLMRYIHRLLSHTVTHRG